MPSRSRRIWAVAAHIVPHHQERASSASKVACTGAAVNLHAAAHAAVPMVDVSPFLSYRRSKLADTGNGSISAAAQDVVDQVGRACRAVGFIVVTGHGIDPSLTRSCADEAARFFRQPEGAKLQVAAKGGAFGYIPLNSEALGDDGDATSRPDLREAFAMGPIENLRPTLDSARLSVHDREVLNFCYQPTPWPDAYVYADELPTARRSSTSAGLQPAMENMYLATARLGDGLLRIFGHALGIDEALLLSKTTHHFSAMAAINYPPVTNRQTLQPGQLRCGPHQDSGTLTIVWESAEGLEVTCPHNGLIVNVGDLMTRWTNGRWLSTPHRVRVPQASELSANTGRLSIAWFQNLSWDAEITNLFEEEEALFPPITQGELFWQREGPQRPGRRTDAE